MNLKLSKEVLVHFQCSSCSKWWTIGDAPDRGHWFCPWCGVKQDTPNGTKKENT